MAEGGTIRVDRTFVGFRDRLRRYTILVDGEKVGTVKNGDSALVGTSVGVHRVRMKAGLARSPELQVRVDAGDTVVFTASARPTESGPQMMYEGLFKLREYILLEQGSSVPAQVEKAETASTQSPLMKGWRWYLTALERRDARRSPHPVLWGSLAVIWVVVGLSLTVVGSGTGPVGRSVKYLAVAVLSFLGAAVAIYRARLARARQRHNGVP